MVLALLCSFGAEIPLEWAALRWFTVPLLGTGRLRVQRIAAAPAECPRFLTCATCLSVVNCVAIRSPVLVFRPTLFFVRSGYDWQ